MSTAINSTVKTAEVSDTVGATDTAGAIGTAATVDTTENHRHAAVYALLAAVLAVFLMFGSLTLSACSSCSASTDINDYPEDVQRLYQEYEDGYLSDRELADGYKALLNQDVINQAEYDALTDMVGYVEPEDE